MKSVRNSVSFALACALVLFAFERPAHAYTDPGTGMLLWQLLLSASVGAMFYFQRVRRWFSGLLKKKNESDVAGDE